MSDAIQIDIAGIVCNTDTPDADGVLWECAPIEGWASAEIRTGKLTPTGQHGTSPLRSLYDGRPVRAFGIAQAPDQSTAWDVCDMLAALLDLNESGDLIAYEGVPKRLTVTIAGPPKISDPVNGLVLWDLDLLAAFPYKTILTPLVTPIGAASSDTVTNGGTVAAYPAITLTSGGTVDLVIGGRHFTTDTLPSGAVIDMWSRTVTDGADVSLYAAKDPASEWLALPKGAPLVAQDGTAGLDFTTYDTYA